MGMYKCSGCLNLNKECTYTPSQRWIPLTKYLDRVLYEEISKQRIESPQKLKNYDFGNTNLTEKFGT